MADIRVFMSVSLDGVMQAPAQPDEDTRGGFSRGGWAARYADRRSTGSQRRYLSTRIDLVVGARSVGEQRNPQAIVTPSRTPSRDR